MVRVTRPDGATVEWSVLDTAVGKRGTIVCVHGNPTWGYLWKDFLTTLSPDWRVIAVDQTGMGWSERSEKRTLEQRVEELVAFCQQQTTGPFVLAAHDWGGPVALGAVSSLDVQAVILGNTGVGLPARTSVPPLISTARRFVDLVCRRSPAFVSGTALMTKQEHRAALRAPYRSSDRRAAVADFVADIPLSESDVSWTALQKSADNLQNLRVPLLLVWGGRDLVFHDRFLEDMVKRAPHADVHRFPNAAHLVPLDEPMAAVAATWLDDVLRPAGIAPVEREDDVRGDSFVSIAEALLARSNDESSAFTDRAGSVSWASLARDADATARMLVKAGLQVGDRVAMLVPPGADLLIAAYGVWLAGGVLVVADTGLGPRGLRTMLRGANPKWVFGTTKSLSAAKALGWTPGARMISTRRYPHAISIATHRSTTSAALPALEPNFEAAIVHTSGSTGPAKPVRYSHRALSAQRDVIRESFSMTTESGFLTSFAPFILLGPALGVPCVLPDIDVTKPAQLDFDRFAQAVHFSRVEVAWLSPASARRIVETAAGRTVDLRLVMLAGAPISTQLASAIAEVTNADVRSPWGMTEVMPITDGVGATTAVDGGTTTGSPLAGARVLVLSLDGTPQPVSDGEWGELAVHAPWMFDGYEQQWGTDSQSELLVSGQRFHRTGDLGLINASGNIQQLGRVQHALFVPERTVPSVLVEDPISRALGRQVAAVGVGPVGTQVIAIVIESVEKLRLADSEMTRRVRESSTFEISAVLEGELPVDIRHQSKVKREVLAESVSAFLAGR